MLLLGRLPRLPRASSRLPALSSFAPADPAKLDWGTIGFKYVPTKSMVVAQFDNGQWGRPESSPEPFLRIHALSNALHYGQAVFEGLKAFAHKDNTVHAFRSNDNAARMQLGSRRLGMPEVPTELFNELVDRAIRENVEYVPPYGSGGALYLRPFLFGHGGQLGLGRAKQYMFGVVANPVGNYYPQGPKPVKGVVLKYDRAAPFGVGNVKTAGNYAPDVVPSSEASARGYTIVLYLDAAKHEYVEEFSTSNFVAISKDGKSFITPDSNSILRSVTNLCLQQIASDIGLKVERRPVHFSEVSSFREVSACGTAVVITPLAKIVDERIPGEAKEITIGDGSSFPIMMELYNRIRAIQTGDAKDVHGWNRLVCSRK